MDKDYIFRCKKCYHNLYVDKSKITELLEYDCPECGEEADDLWIFSGVGFLRL